MLIRTDPDSKHSKLKTDFHYKIISIFVVNFLNLFGLFVWIYRISLNCLFKCPLSKESIIHIHYILYNE